jgi:hypothetical protein
VSKRNRGNENAESLVIENFRETGVLDGRLEKLAQVGERGDEIIKVCC